MSSGAVESEKNGSALRTVVGSRDFARFEPRRDGERGRADDGRGPGELVHLEGGDGGGERPPDVETDGRIAREALERLHRAEGERRRLPHEAQDERLDLRLDRERQPFGVPGDGFVRRDEGGDDLRVRREVRERHEQDVGGVVPCHVEERDEEERLEREADELADLVERRVALAAEDVG